MPGVYTAVAQLFEFLHFHLVLGFPEMWLMLSLTFGWWEGTVKYGISCTVLTPSKRVSSIDFHGTGKHGTCTRCIFCYRRDKLMRMAFYWDWQFSYPYSG